MELKRTLQAKNEQSGKLTQTMNSMLDRVESLQNRIANMEAQTTPNTESVPLIGCAKEAPQYQYFGNGDMNTL